MGLPSHGGASCALAGAATVNVATNATTAASADALFRRSGVAFRDTEENNGRPPSRADGTDGPPPSEAPGSARRRSRNPHTLRPYPGHREPRHPRKPHGTGGERAMPAPLPVLLRLVRQVRPERRLADQHPLALGVA